MSRWPWRGGAGVASGDMPGPAPGRGDLVVVTGCDSGIGRSLAELLHERGYTVAVSYLTTNPFEGVPDAHARRLDLRVPAEVEEFIGFVRGLCASEHTLTAVVSNAGVALGGPVEDVPLALFREVFEVNFFGAVRIIQALIPDLVGSRGRVVVVGSLAGRVALPFLSPYAASKFAVEGFCDSLRRELNPFGIRTILIEPAAVATPIWNRALTQDISFVSDTYRESLDLFRTGFVEDGNKGMPADAAAKVIADTLVARNPRPRYLIAGDRVRSSIVPHVPSRVVDAAVARWFRMDYGRRHPRGGATAPPAAGTHRVRPGAAVEEERGTP